MRFSSEKDFIEQIFPTLDYLDRAFAADSITPTVFGVTLAPLLMATRDLLEWNLPHRRKLGEYKPVPGSPVPENIYALFTLGQKSGHAIKLKKSKPGDPFFLPFVSLFAGGELEKTLPRGESKPKDGIYVFKVSLETNI